MATINGHACRTLIVERIGLPLWLQICQLTTSVLRLKPPLLLASPATLGQPTGLLIGSRFPVRLLERASPHRYASESCPASSSGKSAILPLTCAKAFRV